MLASELLATFYRSGFLVEKNIDRAYHILLNAYNLIDDEDLRELAKKAMAHYKQNIFGKYRYIE